MKRITSLQGLRAIAFIMVFLNHMDVSSASGGIGVAIFFELSGFLMIYNYFPTQRILPNNIKSMVKFGYSKLKKLYLPYIVTGIACLPQLVLSSTPLFSVVVCLLYAMFLQSWVPVKNVAMGLNGAAWFISSLLFSYVIFPFFLMLLRKLDNSKEINNKRILLFLLLIFLLRIIWRNIFVGWYWPYVFPIFRSLDFISGGLIGLIYIKNSRINKKISTILLLLLIVGIIIGSISYKYMIIKMLVSGPICLLLIFLCSSENNLINKICLFPFLTYIGNISMYTYLTHGVVIRYVNHFMNGNISILLNICRWILIISLTWLTSEILLILNKRKAKK